MLSGCTTGQTASFEDEPQQETTNQQDDGGQDEDGAQDDGDGNPDDDDAETDAGGSGTDDGSADDDVSAESAAAAGIDLNSLGDPIGTATVSARVEGDPDATMDIAFYGLERDGDTLVGTFSFTVHTEGGSDQGRWIYHYLFGQSWYPHLIDTTNLTRHDVLGGSIGGAVTNSQGTMFRPGQTMYAYAAFAAPPEGVTTMTVQIIDGAAPLTGVEIP